MNLRLGRLVGGCFAAGCAIACSMYFAASPSAIAASDTTWTAIDPENLFLHDLTDGPATFVVAMVIGADGAVTADIADVSAVKFAPAGSKVVAAKSNDAVAMESALDRSIVMNSGDQLVVAYFQNAEGLQEIHLYPGEGVAIGALPDTAVNRYQWGCKCVCKHGSGEFEDAIMLCTDVFPNQTIGEPCDCIELVTTQCWFIDEDGVLLDGQMDGCKNGLLPIRKGTP